MTTDVLGLYKPTDGGDLFSVFWAGLQGNMDIVDGTALGWIPSGETWTYASADDPTYTFTISGDKTAKYYAGMKIKLTQTTDRYFIITAVAYGAPNTTITVYGGTDYDLAGAAITSPCFSVARCPAGFPMSPAKWSVVISDSSDYSQSSPTDTTWYNLGSGALAISAPIGLWYASYEAFCYIYKSTYAAINIGATLSTANNSESNTELHAEFANVGGGSTAVQSNVILQKHWLMTSAAKTVWYLNLKVRASLSATTIGIYGARMPTRIELVCAYL